MRILRIGLPAATTPLGNGWQINSICVPFHGRLEYDNHRGY
jgi:hypothetical protein